MAVNEGTVAVCFLAVLYCFFGGSFYIDAFSWHGYSIKSIILNALLSEYFFYDFKQPTNFIVVDRREEIALSYTSVNTKVNQLYNNA